MNQDKIFVVTGASRGLGNAVSKYIADQGNLCYGIARSPQPESWHKNAIYRSFDASDESAVMKFWHQLKDDHAESEVILINNAGGYYAGRLDEASLSDLKQMIKINYYIAATMTKGFVDHFNSGRMVNIVSAAALKPSQTDFAYGSSKAALAHFFGSLQQQYPVEQFAITNLYPTQINTSGANSGIDPQDLASFIYQISTNKQSYHIRDCTLEFAPGFLQK